MPNIQFQFRRGTASQWSTANPTLAAGEMGIETDTDLFKIGDGSTAWNSLAYGGLIGATGAQGATGPNGATGPSGVGATGATGFNGTTGATGFNGTTGATGFDGATGATGPSGVGSTGATGPEGATGPAGSPGGATGFTGSTGATGYNGATGATGVTYILTSASSVAVGTGTKNFVTDQDASATLFGVGNFVQAVYDSSNIMFGLITAFSGTNLTMNVGRAFGSGTRTSWTFYISGLSGASGPNGSSGATGAIGFNGATGAIGFDGATGATGIGATGSTGAQGATGPQGSPGGATGLTGATGIGATGFNGSTGATGPTGIFGGLSIQYRFNTGTSDSDPGPGRIAFNNSDISSATEMYIDDEDIYGVDVQAFLRTLDDSTSTVKTQFRIGNIQSLSDFAFFNISGFTEMTGYFKFNVSWVDGTTAFTNLEDLVTTFTRVGDKGDTGDPGGATGPYGSTGATGYNGATGAVGPAGGEGATGATGAVGPAGGEGATGATGAVGPAGGEGATGATGPNQEITFSIQTGNFNAVVGSRYGVDTTSTAITATLPASPTSGDAIFFADAGGFFGTNNLTLDRNGNNINGSASNLTINTNGDSIGVFWNGSSWRSYD